MKIARVDNNELPALDTATRGCLPNAHRPARGRVLATVLAVAASFPGVAGADDTTQLRALEAQIAELHAALASMQQQLALLQPLAPLVPHLRILPDPMEGLSGPHIVFEGANVHVRSGTGRTADGSGRGNLIVGYNEEALNGSRRSGSHNLVVGPAHSYTSFGGFVAGLNNTLGNMFTVIAGGVENVASGPLTTVSGGRRLEASNRFAAVNGAADGELVSPVRSVAVRTGER